MFTKTSQQAVRVPAKHARTSHDRTHAGLSMWTHLTALLVASVVAAMAFGLPAEPLQISNSFERPVEIEVALPLPDAAQASLYQASEPLDANAWTTATVQPGDNLSRIFNRLGLKADDLYSLMACCRESKSLTLLKPGETFKIRTDDGGELVELVRTSQRDSALRLFREGDHFKVGKFRHFIEKRPSFVAATVRRSFPADARAAGLSEHLLKQLQGIVGKRLDLSTDLQPGASFTILFEEDFFSGEKIGDGDILAIDLVQQDRQFRVVGFRDSSGELRYYTPQGESLRPAFLRYPVRFDKISSRFNLSRRHPLLGVRRPHKGVDLAAPAGTPIRAVGDGVVQDVGWQSGYGKTIVLDHGRGYTTLYGHMSRFNKKLQVGSSVSKGQIIGYVGRTGLATGNHVHYEFRVNDQPRNPLTVALPGDPPLKGQQRARFQQKTQLLLAQLDLHQRTQLALNSTASGQ